MGLNNTFPRALEEELYNEHLESRHGNHQATLHQAEVEYPLLSTLDGTEVPVLARAEVLLVAGDGGKLGRELEDGFFKDGGLLRGGTRLAWDFGAGGLILNLRVDC